jgi:hypothetical protein
MRIATVDAVSADRQITATLSHEARHKAINGAYTIITSDGDKLLGRITGVELTNQVHENKTFAPYRMVHGAVPNWSKEVDIEIASVQLIRAIDEQGNFVPLRRNPPSGTPIEAVSGADDIAAFHNDREHYAVVGHIPHSDGVPATIINRSFGAFDQGGYGEARHTAIFGQNGSGKSVIALILAALKLIGDPSMGFLAPDLAGDLVNPDSYTRGSFSWNFQKVLAAAGAKMEVISIDDIRLTSCRLLQYKLAPLLHDTFSTDEEKSARLAQIVIEHIHPAGDTVDLAAFTADRVMDEIVSNIARCYAPSGQKQRENDARITQADPAVRYRFDREIARIRRVFDGRHDIGDLLSAVLQRGRKVMIVPGGQSLSEADKQFIWLEIVNQLGWRAKRAFEERGGRSCNAMIMLDEGQDWVPQTLERDGGNAQRIRDKIREHLRTTRKYGVGWMIVAQSPAGIHNEVLRQAHTKYFGRNLNVGADRAHLETQLGKPGCAAYDELQMQGGYFWAAVGHDNNLGVENTYFSFIPFGGDATQALIDANPHIFGPQKVRW